MPLDAHRNRASCRHALSYCHLALGEFDQAASHAEFAALDTAYLEPLFLGKLTWLHAVIAFKQAEYDRSESLLREVVTTFTDIHRGEAALATIDLAEVQLAANKPADAYASAQAILPLITPLGARNKVVRSAEVILTDLARRGASGMHMQVVEKLRDLVKRAKRERQWRSLSSD